MSNRLPLKWTRRQLLGAGAGVAVAGAAQAVAATPAAAEPRGNPKRAFTNAGTGLLPDERIGVQLYSVKDQVQNLGFGKVFETLAGIGFTSVEFAGTAQNPPIKDKTLRRLLDLNGLTAIGNHANPSEGNDAWMDEAAVLGMPWAGTAFAIPQGNTVSAWKQLAAQYTKWGEGLRERGMKGFYLHCHGPEYAQCADNPALRGIDILLKDADPRVFFFEMDIYWAYVFLPKFGGPDPVDLVTAHRDRFPLFHVKDGKIGVQGPGIGHTLAPAFPDFAKYLADITDVGQGNIDFERFFTRIGGPKKHWYINENDIADSHAKGSFGSVKTSYLHMRHGLKPRK